MKKPLNEQIKSKEFWKRVGLFLFAVLLVVVGPIIINECYKPNKGYLTVWGGAEVLSYYGTLLGAVATIWVLDRTIRFTCRQIRYDRYIQNEEAKWKQIEALSVAALDYIQPVKLNEMYVIALSRLPQRYLSPEFVIFTTQSQTLCNAIHCNVTEKDKEVLRPFLKALEEIRKSTRKIADDLYDLLQNENGIISKHNEKAAEILLEKHKSQSTDLINQANKLQEKEYNELLQLKRDVFAKIYEQIEKDAMKLL